MTTATSEQLAELLSGVKLLMLDFDGPVCSVFAGLSAGAVAARLRDVLRTKGVVAAAELESGDPLAVYRSSASYGAEITKLVHDELVSAEIRAVATAEPTPGAEETVRAAKASGRYVAIVSNNAADAVEAYVHNHRLAQFVDYIAARRTPEPDLMKPNPQYLIEAADAISLDGRGPLLVGDSETDIEAAINAGIPAIGYANKPGKSVRLSRCGATAIISQMQELVGPLKKAACA